MIDSVDNDCNQSLALFLNKKGNKQRGIASFDTPFIWMTSHISNNEEKWRFGSSLANPSNWFACTNWMTLGLSSKLLALIPSLLIDDWAPSTYGIVKSLNVLGITRAHWSLCFAIAPDWSCANSSLLKQSKVLPILNQKIQICHLSTWAYNKNTRKRLKRSKLVDIHYKQLTP